VSSAQQEIVVTSHSNAISTSFFSRNLMFGCPMNVKFPDLASFNEMSVEKAVSIGFLPKVFFFFFLDFF